MRNFIKSRNMAEGRRSQKNDHISTTILGTLRKHNLKIFALRMLELNFLTVHPDGIPSGNVLFKCPPIRFAELDFMTSDMTLELNFRQILSG